MRIRYAHVLLITEVVLVITLASRGILSAKDAKDQRQQPLSNADAMLREVNQSGLRGVNQKALANMTDLLNDMAANMRKMFSENKKMQQQMQEVLARVSNATGVNATGVAASVQERAANVPMNLTTVNGLGSLLPSSLINQ